MEQVLSSSYKDFLTTYGASEEAWAAYFNEAKWPSGFSCPQCEHNQAYTIQTRKQPVYQCRSCCHQTTLTAGTILEGSRTLLSKWAFAIHTVAHSESGINAIRLQSLINVTYKTAWAMLNKIRHAISSHDLTRPLSGLIKGGLAFCGKYAPSTIRLTAQEHPVIIASAQAEEQPEDQLVNPPEEQPEIVKIKLVSRSRMDEKTLTPTALKAFIQDHIAYTDNIKKVTIDAHKIRPRRYRNLVNLMSQFRSWVNHTFHGLGTKHLQGYLDEFCFRLNHVNHATQSLALSEHLTRICTGYRVN